MSNSEAFNGLTCQNVLFREFNQNSTDISPDYKQNGLYIQPSQNVPLRPSDITGYVLTAFNEEGKVVWSPNTVLPEVPGQGSVWFSDADGEPIGDPDNFNWDIDNSILLVNGSFRFENSDGDTFTIQSSPTQTVATLSWTLPINNGTNDQVLTTNGSGILSWTSKGGGGQTVAGQGNLWFSDVSGSPIGSTGNLVWDEVNKYLTAGDRIQLNNNGFQFSITPDTLATDIDWVIPATNGSSGQLLSNDGAGNLSWVSNQNVAGTGRVWFSDVTGEPIGSSDFVWNGTILNIVGGTEVDTLELRQGLNTITFQTQATLGTSYTLQFPDDAGSNGQLLTTNGSGVLSWSTVTPLTPAGSNGDVQYKNGTSLAASNDFNYDGTILSVSNAGNNGQVTTDILTVGASFDVNNAGEISGTGVSITNTGKTVTLNASASQVPANTIITFPTTAGTSGQYLETDGAGNLSWSTVVTSPGGADTQVQFNNAGSFGGSSDFTWDGTILSVSNAGNNGQVTTDILTVGASFDVDNAGDTSVNSLIVNSGQTTLASNGDIFSGGTIQISGDFDGRAFFSATASITIAGVFEGTGVSITNTGKTVTLNASASQVPANTIITFPTTAGTSGQYLETDGAGNLSWSTVVTSPGGADTQVQFNNSGSFGGSASFTWDGTSVSIGNITLDSSNDTITADTVTTTSDLRLKENVERVNAKDSMEILENVNCYSYNLKGKESTTYGVIAQELEKFGLLKKMVNENQDGYKSVDYIQMIPLLVEIVKDLSREVKQLKQQWN